MAKNNKGRELGKGLSQRKDGRFSARFVSKSGKRIEKYFDTLPEARNWLEDARYNDKHGNYTVPSRMTVNEWFDYWVRNIIYDLAPNTIRNYTERYIQNVKDVIGDLYVSDVKPLHCKKVLRKMEETYAGSTIRQTYIMMGTMFKSALMNDIISKHPMDGVRYSKPVRARHDIKFLTIAEQNAFLQVASKSHNYNQYRLVLETGIRTGELIGLTWDNVDWEKRTLTINKTLEYRHKQGYWRAGPPKTLKSYRTIPLTTVAYNILCDIYANKDLRKQSETLDTTLEYLDRSDGMKKQLVMKDLIFINYRTGEPAKNSSYDTHLYKLCDEAGIKRFCMHALRHTYATRAIERGVQPKVLQKLLGHASLQTTMDTYVHVTDDSLENAVKVFENGVEMV